MRKEDTTERAMVRYGAALAEPQPGLATIFHDMWQTFGTGGDVMLC
jgi:hypothetical protein